MWQRIRRKYFIGLIPLSVLYQVSFAPALYYLMHHANPTSSSLSSFQTVYRMPIRVLPTSTMVALVHVCGYPRPEAVIFAQELKGLSFRLS